MFKITTTAIFALVIFDAAPARSASAKADFEYGKHLAAECVTCHSAEGKDKGIPPITGWDQQSFILVINSYKSKEREHPAMRLIAGRLDDEQIASLALYFGSLPEED